MRQLREAVTDVGHVALHPRIVVDAHFTANFHVDLPAVRDFLGLAHERNLAIARNRVRGTRGDGNAEGDREDSCRHSRTLGRL